MIRTRFAPSPTGYLHVGGARTALFSWLYARKHGGEFVLRIEDTDLERSTEESVNAILEGMSWLGLEYDEGPFYQTQRFSRYREIINELMDRGLAYRCNCSKDRLEQLRERQMQSKQKPRYDGHCRNRSVSADESHVIRFKNPQTGAVVMDDMVRGRILFYNEELDDLIIQRSDGSPTYNLSVVVDDGDMGITDVIRGDDHINNTPRQINILKALGWPEPRYAHVPMILGDDGSRLSKRHGAVSVMQYKEEGYMPEALLNYLVRLGWSHGDQEIFSLDEMIQLFDLGAVNKSASSFNTEKLLWLNEHHIKVSKPRHVAHHLSWHLGQLGIDPALDHVDLDAFILAHQDKVNNLQEMARMAIPYYRDFQDYDAAAAKKHLRPVALEVLRALVDRLSAVPGWTRHQLQEVVDSTAKDLGVNMGKVGMPLRVALVGHGASPAIDVTLELMGRARTLERLQRAIRFVEQRAQSQ